jgi:hypothetical protein
MSVRQHPRRRVPPAYLARLSPLLIVLAVLAAMLPGAPARAQEADPIVGSWTLAFPAGEPGSRQLVAFQAGGVVAATNAPTFGEPSAPGGRVHSTDGLGAWESLGGGRYAFTVIFLYFDAEEVDWGSLTVDGLVALDPAGDHFAGSFRVTVTDAAGMLVHAADEEPVVGARIRPPADSPRGP